MNPFIARQGGIQPSGLNYRPTTRRGPRVASLSLNIILGLSRNRLSQTNPKSIQRLTNFLRDSTIPLVDFKRKDLSLCQIQTLTKRIRGSLRMAHIQLPCIIRILQTLLSQSKVKRSLNSQVKQSFLRYILPSSYLYGFYSQNLLRRNLGECLT